MLVMPIMADWTPAPPQTHPSTGDSVDGLKVAVTERVAVMVGPELSPRLPRVLPRWAPEEADYSAEVGADA